MEIMNKNEWNGMKSNEILAKYTVHEYLCVCFVYKITLGLKKKMIRIRFFPSKCGES